MARTTLAIVVVAALFAVAAADLYMQMPPNSNNRLNENNQDRTTNNRLYDSQNNNRGGYNVGDTGTAAGTGDSAGRAEYYPGSILSIEWNNQHGAKNPKVHAQIIMQYMCENDDAGGVFPQTAGTNGALRDGTTTNQVNAGNAADASVGRHETVEYFNACNNRNRNEGLYLADQDLNGDSAQFTRQNTNGGESGLECAEERDHYPYWHPAVWKDVAVLTSEPERCAYYQAQSMNVLPKSYCDDTQYNNEIDCTTNGANWQQSASHGIDAPACEELPWQRDNHLGGTIGGYTSMWNWTMPAPTSGTDEVCVFRARYNISTDDFDGWTINASSNQDDNADPPVLPPLQDNPTYNFGTDTDVVSVKLAMNTDQYFRTFQARSHTFVLKAPAAMCPTGTLYNLRVRGRRGNIVQTFPAVEYDFAPTALQIAPGDCVHLQWTGSLSTPDGAGQGAAETDKSNVIQIASAGHNYPLTFDDTSVTRLFTDVNDRLFFANGGVQATPANNEELNNAPASNTGRVFQPGNGVVGVYHFMSTRNNNFTNRSQKGVIKVA